MRRSLTIHRDCRSDAVQWIEVELSRPEPDVLRLHYILRGALPDIAIPHASRTAPLRVDGLWEHTCFEAFIAQAGAPGYMEFNFSPAIQYAAYAFDGYRAGMRPLALDAEPYLGCMNDGGYFLKLDAFIKAAFIAAPMRLALSAVVEEKSGAKSYWALAHPPGKPDFHHDAGFVLDFPGTEQS
ncbi:MAG: hypothetical protein GC206_00540 [Alphaproteobacteria bacterium]|nr:hypothetical protein [Alphaproteobacteria bacterium]